MASIVVSLTFGFPLLTLAEPLEVHGFLKHAAVVAPQVRDLDGATLVEKDLAASSTIFRLAVLFQPIRAITLDAAWQGALGLASWKPAALGAAGLNDMTAVILGGHAGPEALPLQSSVFDGTRNISQRVDWLSVTVEAGPVRVIAGRQAITWGSGRFYSPLDLVRPFPAWQLDREVKPGVDAVTVDVGLGPSAQGSVVAAALGPGLTGAWMTAARGIVQVGPLTFAACAAYRGSGKDASAADVVLGGSVEADPWGIGLRLEGTWTGSATRFDAGFSQLVVSADHGFASGLYLLAEYYRNGHGATRPAGYPAALTDTRRLRGETLSAGRDELGLMTSVPLTPEWMLSLSMLANPRDRSALACPRLSWIPDDRSELSAGLILAYGEPVRWQKLPPISSPVEAVPDVRTEFGSVPSMIHVSGTIRF